MDNELRRNPDTGEVERKVVSFEKVELAQLQQSVETHQTAVNQLTEREDQLNADLENVRKDRGVAETALADSKSQLEAYSQVAGVEQGSDDSGSEVAESVAEEASEGEAVDVPVTVTTENVEGTETPVF